MFNVKIYNFLFKLVRGERMKLKTHTDRAIENEMRRVKR